MEWPLSRDSLTDLAAIKFSLVALQWEMKCDSNNFMTVSVFYFIKFFFCHFFSAPITVDMTNNSGVPDWTGFTLQLHDQQL